MEMIGAIHQILKDWKKNVVSHRFYGGSMPCMPARREIHTGKYNFYIEGGH